ncbi:MAG: septum formation family protein, partial [Bifidobacteriaceae bacterium]|nr:septum formation family protein [Bifidobacteriaceae bacterium]
MSQPHPGQGFGYPEGALGQPPRPALPWELAPQVSYPPRPPRRRRSGWTTLVVAVTLIAFLLVGVLTAVNPAPRGRPGGRALPPFAAGDCFETQTSAIRGADDAVPCESPHASEVIAVAPLSGPESYDTAAIQAEARGVCLEEFARVAPAGPSRAVPYQ